MNISEKDFELLRKKVAARVNEKRYLHILSVEETAVLLAELLLPDMIDELRCAAILHDVTKLLSYDEHIKLITEDGTVLTDEDYKTELILHSFSAPAAIKRDFPEYATDNILSAVRNHTVGAPHMSVFDKIIFISDYIEAKRGYEASKSTRKFLLEGLNLLSYEDRLRRLDEACLMSIVNTKAFLINNGKDVNSRMELTEKSLK